MSAAAPRRWPIRSPPSHRCCPGCDGRACPPVDLDTLLAPGAGPGVALVFDDGCASLADRGAAAAARGRRTGAPLPLHRRRRGHAGRRRAPAAVPAARLGRRRAAASRGRRDRGAHARAPRPHPLAALARRGRVRARRRADRPAPRAVAALLRLSRRPPRRERARGRRRPLRRRVRHAARGARARDDRYALPRLDAHYLRHAFARRLDSPASRAWIAFRGALRRAAHRT